MTKSDLSTTCCGTETTFACSEIEWVDPQLARNAQSTLIFEMIKSLRIDIENSHLMFRCDQVRCHVFTHVAKAEEADRCLIETSRMPLRRLANFDAREMRLRTYRARERWTMLVAEQERSNQSQSRGRIAFEECLPLGSSWCSVLLVYSPT